MFRNASLGTRLSTLCLILVTLLLLLSGAFRYLHTQQRLEAALQADIQGVTQRLEQSLPTAVWNIDKTLMERIVRGEMSQPALVGILVWNGNEVMGGFQRSDSGQLTAISQLSGAVREIPLVYDDNGKKSTAGKVQLLISNAQVRATLRQDMAVLAVEILVLDALIVLVMSLALRAMVSRPLADVSRSLADMVSGQKNLGHRLDEGGAPELAALARSFNVFIHRLDGLIREVSNGAKTLSQAADSAHQVAVQTDQSVQNQKSAVQSIGHAVQRAAEQLNRVAANARETSSTTHAANDNAQRGRQVVEETEAVMLDVAQQVEAVEQAIAALAQDSASIGGVVSAINDVTKQINLLALNAAIEAARAGEAGRGFAVVADEVRQLARRTDESTREIQVVVTRLQEATATVQHTMQQGRAQAQRGVAQAQRAGEEIGALSDVMQRIRDLNTEIADTAQQQIGAVDDVVQDINKINGYADETALYSRRNAEAATQLSGLARQLQSQVDQAGRTRG